jgi:hypothetical protein
VLHVWHAPAPPGLGRGRGFPIEPSSLRRRAVDGVGLQVYVEASSFLMAVAYVFFFSEENDTCFFSEDLSFRSFYYLPLASPRDLTR